MQSHSTEGSKGIRPIFAAIRAVPVAHKVGSEAAAPVRPFVTISREPGAGAWTLARQLVEALNCSAPGDQPWTSWDRELVEKVAAEHHLAEQVVESLEDARPSWVTDFLSSLTPTDDPYRVDEAKVYESVAETIRSLAQSGRVVIVGRGGVFITRRMPGGIHVRLTAPFEQRVAFMAKQMNLSQEATAAYLRHLERNRQAFYKRYWPGESLGPDAFTLTLNTAVVETPDIIEAVQVLVRRVALPGVPGVEHASDGC